MFARRQHAFVAICLQKEMEVTKHPILGDLKKFSLFSSKWCEKLIHLCGFRNHS